MERSIKCLGCGYILNNLITPYCPECGRYFNIKDPSTYLGALSPKWRKLAKAPSLYHVLIIIGIDVLFIDIISTPGNPYYLRVGFWGTIFLMIIASTLFILLLFEYVYRFISYIKDRDRAAQDKIKQNTVHCWRWFITPISVALISSSLFCNWPLYVRFSLSYSYFENARKKCMDNTIFNTNQQWIGLYPVKNISYGNYYEFSISYFQTGGKIETYDSDKGYVPMGFTYSNNDDSWQNKPRRLCAHWYITKQ